jgi:hypothetical protein
MITTTTTVGMLAALGAHLAGFELPAIASVHITTGMAGWQITVQLAYHGQLSPIAVGLLAWTTVGI